MRYLLIFFLSLLPYLSLPAQTGSHSYVRERTMTNIKEDPSYAGAFNFMCQEASLYQIRIDGGYCTFTEDGVPVAHYYTRDHLGNVREVVDGDGTVEQVTHYYPFGGVFGDACTGGGIQKYKYNGKELDRTHGLDTYDYGARMYDAALPVWDRPDPLAHKYYHVSPYAYCGNDPIIFFDSKGEEPTNYEAALMAKHVYGDNVELVGGWHKSNIQYKSFVNCRNGLKSALYEKTSEEGITEYAYVTSGTEKRDIEDYKEDVLQLFGESSQYRESVQNARVLSRVFPNSEITFVGHSLGGGLAAANALATDRNAITFNPAAITRETKKVLPSGFSPILD